MKSLKFRKHLILEILEGRKTTTWRLFDDKDLQTGDKLEFLDWETKEKFADAEIVGTQEKKLGDITKSDFADPQKYQTTEEMLVHYKEYYGDKVTVETPIKIISFKLRIQ